MKNVYDITNELENKLAEYTGAPYAICLDNASNAIFLSLYYENHIKNNIKNKTVVCPSRTYPSVPCEIIHAGLKIKWEKTKGKTLTGAYQLKDSCVWDSALSFTYNMYKPKSHMCLSFTGPYKHFKLSKGNSTILKLGRWPKSCNVKYTSCVVFPLSHCTTTSSCSRLFLNK